jgi:hypothetical protein
MHFNFVTGKFGYSPAEKAAATRYRNRMTKLTWDMYELLAALPPEAGEADVVKVFADFKAKPDEKGESFRELDERPGRFGANYWTWHSRLRRCRNHPAHGPKLFATFR